MPYKDKEKQKAAQRKWYEKNKQLCAQRTKANRDKDREAYNAKQRAWAKEYYAIEENREKRRYWDKKWRTSVNGKIYRANTKREWYYKTTYGELAEVAKVLAKTNYKIRGKENENKQTRSGAPTEKQKYDPYGFDCIN